eukprot:g161.t1
MEDLYPKAALEKDEHSLSTFKTELNNIDLLDVYEKTPGAKADSFTSFRENLIRAMIHSRFGSPLGKTRMSNSVDEGDPLDQTTRTVRDGTGTNHQSEQGGLFGPWDSSSSAVLGQLPNANQARGPAPAWPIQDPYGGKYVSYDGGNQQTISGYEPAVGSSINPPIPANLSQDYVGYASKELSGLNSRYNAAPTAAASGYSSQVGSSPASRTVLSLDKLLPELRKAYAPANEIEIHPDMEADPESLLVFVGKKRKRKRKRRSRKSRGGDAGDEAAEAGDDLSDVAEEEDEEDSPVKEIGLAKDIVPKVVGAGSGPRSGTGVDAGRRGKTYGLQSQYSNSAGSYNDHYTNTYPPTSHAHQMKGDSYGRHPSLQQSSGSAYDPSYSGGKMSKGGKQGETSEAGGKAKGSWRPSGWQ